MYASIANEWRILRKESAIYSSHVRRLFLTRCRFTVRLKVNPNETNSAKNVESCVANANRAPNKCTNTAFTVHTPFENCGQTRVVQNAAIATVDYRQLPFQESEWKAVEKFTAKSLTLNWLRLSKFRLTSLVVLTTLAGFSMASSTAFDPYLLSATLVGTALTSSSAASLNQFLEIPFDSQMVRTRNRPLVCGQISPLHAITFSTVTCVSGLTLLLTCVNPITAGLGAFNLLLYSFIYTPMKRSNIVNTWIGSIVGAVPPVMGFTAVTGTIGLPAVLVGLVLYSWQFPHFNALSWNLRHDYARAGYRMMSVTNPSLCLRTALRHSYLISIYSLLMCTPALGLTNLSFAIASLPLNAYLIYLTHKFKGKPDANSSRKLFRYSLIHLPSLIILMLLCKRSKKKENVDEKTANNAKYDVDLSS
ncbi:protoheme IX farnesyltransferase: mitochondrial-like protein [Dinothrombium tinctorium]|uniref:Protoheme IX farnesyltransferase, mitochondrial n=1 Tax=Dinothrombium tinctorium TaxID=1965070 RepID=A0A443QSX3_9ACAR|nr:protoheme IX farnesyltransferase: mitochondrial-like protein [Dinothrombium tinctorium]